MWDTQMGEDTFADPKEMTTDQLEGKLAYLETEASKLRKEKQARDVGANAIATQAPSV
jgi:predicted RecA/RadA family phage recombinase